MKPNIVKIIFTDTTQAPFRNAELWLPTGDKIANENSPILVHIIGGQGEHMTPAEAERRLREYIGM